MVLAASRAARILRAFCAHPNVVQESGHLQAAGAMECDCSGARSGAAAAYAATLYRVRLAESRLGGARSCVALVAHREWPAPDRAGSGGEAAAGVHHPASGAGACRTDRAG